jgi:hypothetical protein
MMLVLASVAAFLTYSNSAPLSVGASQPLAAELTDANFQVRSYVGKCLSYGAPLQPGAGAQPQTSNSPVYIYDCNGSRPVAQPVIVGVAQQVRVVELPASNDRANGVRRPREVQLRAGDKCIGAAGNFMAPGVPLVLQNCNGSAGQTFALDGDSIIFARDRALVVEVKNARSQNGTPLVVGERDLDDSEFWSFTATDGSDTRPTSGFVHASNAWELLRHVYEAKWGAVIEVGSAARIELLLTVNLPAGVTIRGDRRGLAQGPELHWPDLTQGPMLAIEGDHVRITGLRLRGPSRSTDSDLVTAAGILARENFFSIIDHNELSDWTGHAVDVKGDLTFDRCNEPEKAVCPPQRSIEDFYLNRVRVARNFIHHNRRQNRGYGVLAREGGFPMIEGNTFVSNRHAIAGDGRPRSGYRAQFNLVLADAPTQHKYGWSWHTQDFDMHGTDCADHWWETDWVGGLGGEYMGIKWNTFLGTNQENFDLRGVPCYLAEFHGNVSRRSRGGAVNYYRPPTPPIGVHPSWLSVEGNEFESPNPTDRLGVGDFDGDGKQDTFLATGTAWYYAPGGQAEWRYLRNSGAKLDELLLGDFDGDGRTDVLTQSGREWRVSWGGISRPERINAQDGQISDYHVGDFNGDGRDDVFYANGYQWFLSLGGAAPLTPFAQAGHRTSDLRFGDFNGDGKTDIFGVVDGDWKVVYGGEYYWTRLRSALTDKVKDLVVADFNSDGRADVASSTRDGLYHDWRISSGGVSNWASLRQSVIVALTAVPAIGQFDARAGADVLFWPGQYVFRGTGIPVLEEENYLDIAPSGIGLARHSRHDMR